MTLDEPCVRKITGCPARLSDSEKHLTAKSAKFAKKDTGPRNVANGGRAIELFATFAPVLAIFAVKVLTAEAAQKSAEFAEDNFLEFNREATDEQK